MTATQQQQHTVIVGGGIAGLTAATYLARGGAAVTVVEKASKLGGRGATDYVNDFALNRGAHAVYSGGPSSEVLRELGVGYTYGIPKRVYAVDERGIHPFPTSLLTLLRTTLLDAADKRELLGCLLRVGTISPASVQNVSVADYIDHNARRPRVKTLLRSVARVVEYSAAIDLASADTFVARLQQTARHAVHYVDGGWQTIVDGLRNAALNAGAAIRQSTSAETIRIDNGRATAVRLHDGTELAADSVLLAVPPTDALHLLGTAPRLRSQLAKALPAHIACLDVALERLPNSRATAVFDMQQPRFVSVQSTVARVAPDGGAVIHLFKQLDPRVAGDQHQDAEDMAAALDYLQPGWREVLVEKRFLPRMLGSSWLPLANQGGLAARPTYHSQDVSNVYFAGDWVGPRGYLADVSFDSAREAARLILRSAMPLRQLLQAA